MYATLRGQKAHGLVTGWEPMAEVEDLCSDVGEKVKEAGLAPDGADLHMLNRPASHSQGFRQSHFQKISALDPGGAGSEGWGCSRSVCGRSHQLQALLHHQARHPRKPGHQMRKN